MGSSVNGVRQATGVANEQESKERRDLLSARPSSSFDDLVTSIPIRARSPDRYNVGVVSYAGHVQVVDSGPGKGNFLYYWFFESQERPQGAAATETPLVIWLNGGPGASSLAGLFLENGPFLMNDDGEVVDNPNGWNARNHLLYWDQPVGTGFSYTTDGDGGYVTNEDQLSEQFYTGLQGFYARHPEYRACSLYLTGESYAGKYIPFIAKKIAEKNRQATAQTKINLKGLAIGDGWMNPGLQTRLQITYGYEMGFVDTRQRAIADELYADFCNALEKGDMPTAFQLGNNVSNMVLACGGNPDIYDVRRWSDLSISALRTYLDNPEVKHSIHVPQNITWQFADATSTVADKLVNDLMADMTSILPALISEYRVMMYTGNFDMSCGFVGTEQILQRLSWPGQERWKALQREVWTDSSDQVMGYIKALESLTQVVIPDAGHMVPHDKPQISRQMLYTWMFQSVFGGYVPVVVRANVLWQDSGLDVQPGMKVSLKAMTGAWTANPSTGFVDAGGNPAFVAKPGYTIPGAHEGALCAKVGASGETFLVGKEKDVPSGLSGRLFFCINDDLKGQYGAGFADNEGAVVIAVRSTPPAAR